MLSPAALNSVENLIYWSDKFGEECTWNESYWCKLDQDWMKNTKKKKKLSRFEEFKVNYGRRHFEYLMKLYDVI